MTEAASFLTSVKSATMSTFVYSLLLTPFDVVKNTQISGVVRRNPFETTAMLYRQSGLKSLWRGLIAASFSTFSNNIIYYPCYEFAKPIFKEISPLWGNGLAAVCCRFIAVFLTLPIERLRTSIQGTGTGKFALTLKGFRVTLYRDVVFSFTYFTILENLYAAVKEHNFLLSRTACTITGALVAAVITHPFDVVKTKVQTRYCCFSHYDRNTIRAVRDVWRKEGWAGLFIGSQPRITKITIGLVIYMNLYEGMKSWVSDRSK
jgi:hypothetical protein